MGVNNLPKTVTRERRGCDLNRYPSAPESSTLTTRLPSHPCCFVFSRNLCVFARWRHNNSSSSSSSFIGRQDGVSGRQSATRRRRRSRLATRSRLACRVAHTRRLRSVDRRPHAAARPSRRPPARRRPLKTSHDPSATADVVETRTVVISIGGVSQTTCRGAE